MKKKEQKALATKIAKVERKLQKATDQKEINLLQSQMMELCGSVNNLEDMTAIDEMVMEILEKT